MLHDLTLARTEARITETSQTALCNQMHSVEQRLSRWLLTFADRSNSEQVKVTQSVVAGMLGVRREGISVAVAALRDAGSIKTSRASITIHDRACLEKRACECHKVIRDAVQAFGGSKPAG